MILSDEELERVLLQRNIDPRPLKLKEDEQRKAEEMIVNQLRLIDYPRCVFDKKCVFIAERMGSQLEWKMWLMCPFVFLLFRWLWLLEEMELFLLPHLSYLIPLLLLESILILLGNNISIILIRLRILIPSRTFLIPWNSISSLPLMVSQWLRPLLIVNERSQKREEKGDCLWSKFSAKWELLNSFFNVRRRFENQNS